MSDRVAELVKAADELSTDERRQLLNTLWERLGPEIDQRFEEAWQQEIDRRTDELDAGTAEMIPWSEVKMRARTQALKRREATRS